MGSIHAFWYFVLRKREGIDGLDLLDFFLEPFWR